MQKFKNQKEVETITKSSQRVLVIYENDVFDVTKFLFDHPGGSSIIEDYNGMDISEVFHDEDIHEHSESAMKMLHPFKIGEIVDENEELIPTKGLAELNNKGSSAYPIVTKDFVSYKNFQIDRRKGLIAQVYHLSKVDYEEFIENPVYLPNCMLFENPFLECLTRNKWYYIPLIWGSVVLYMLYNGITYKYEEASIFNDYLWIRGSNFSIIYVFLALFFGVIFWTKLEYLLHRFVFHCEWWLPDNKFLLHNHFLIHGIHHSIPMDPDRLVFPPIQGICVYFFVYNFVTSIFSGNMARIFIAGFLLGYIAYDMTHYYIHHGNPKSGYFLGMKAYHNKHHYKRAYKGYGISSKFWDYVYGTVIDY